MHCISRNENVTLKIIGNSEKQLRKYEEWTTYGTLFVPLCQKSSHECITMPLQSTYVTRMVRSQNSSRAFLKEMRKLMFYSRFWPPTKHLTSPKMHMSVIKTPVQNTLSSYLPLFPQSRFYGCFCLKIR